MYNTYILGLNELCGCIEEREIIKGTTIAPLNFLCKSWKRVDTEGLQTTVDQRDTERLYKIPRAPLPLSSSHPTKHRIYFLHPTYIYTFPLISSSAALLQVNLINRVQAVI